MLPFFKYPNASELVDALFLTLKVEFTLTTIPCFVVWVDLLVALTVIFGVLANAFVSFNPIDPAAVAAASNNNVAIFLLFSPYITLNLFIIKILL